MMVMMLQHPPLFTRLLDLVLIVESSIRLIVLVLLLISAVVPCPVAASFALPLKITAATTSAFLHFGGGGGGGRQQQQQQRQRQRQRQQQNSNSTTVSMSSSSSSSRTTEQRASSSSSSSLASASSGCSWVSLDPESLVSAKCLIEQTLCQATSVEMPRLAKDYDYATAILEAWRQEEEQDCSLDDEKKNGGGRRPWKTIWKRGNVIYADAAAGTSSTKRKLYGHLIGRVPDDDDSDNGDDNARSSSCGKDDKKKNALTVPGIVLFPTGAGPHDLFLLWKASSLVNTLYSSKDDINNNRNGGCLVLIADILSDESGCCWDDDDDKTRYIEARDNVLMQQPSDNNGQEQQRPVLRQRIQAALDTLLSSRLSSGNDDDAMVYSVDPQRVAAMGWCLGGHAILELAGMTRRQLQRPQKDAAAATTTPCSIRALVAFHGVFDGIPASSLPIDDDEALQQQQQQPGEALPPKSFRTEVLICHGTKDPFVSDTSLEQALAYLQSQPSHITTSLLQLQGARHGFTNPAQDFHPNQQAFGYNIEAATKAWKQAMNVLRRNLVL
jgi:dienelactone hydrolase